jgi:hypothetical protein
MGNLPELPAVPGREHEVGYENLKFDWWHILTGKSYEAYLRWKVLSPKVRRDIVGISTNPEQIKKLRKLVEKLVERLDD